MSRDKSLLIFAIVASLAIGAALPSVLGKLRGAPETPPSVEEPAAAGPDANAIKLTAAQIEAAKIETAAAGPGELTRRITAPATLKPDPDRLARVAAKVAGTVAEMRKRLDDAVSKGETVAVIDSREVADAKSEYLASAVNFDLQSKLYKREQALFAKKITAEQLFLKAKTSYAEAKLRLDLARQKLASLDLSESEITGLASQPMSRLRQKEIRAPISGKVIERLVNIGQPVTAEGQIYVLSDLSVLEADISVPVASLAAIRQGQPVQITMADGRSFDGKITIVSAIVTQETRTGHVVATFPNRDSALHPGVLVNAEIALERAPAGIVVPRAAVQTIHNEPSVFVRNADGFERRVIAVGDTDDSNIEVLAGLKPGDAVAVTNAFVLKAELGKNEIPEE